MNVKELETYLSKYTRGPSDMDLRVRALRAGGHLPTVRGRHAPAVTPFQAAMIMLSAVAQRSIEAGSVATRVAKLPAVPRAGSGVVDGIGFADYLASLIASPEAMHSLPRFHIEIAEAGGFARLIFEDGKSILFTSEERVRHELQQFPDLYDSTGRHGFERRFYISRSALADVAIQLAADEAGEMVAE